MSAPFLVTEGKWAGYTIVVDDQDSASEVWYEERGSEVLRVHFRVFRAPSRKEIKIRHFAASTAEDRAEAESLIPHLARLFERWEDTGKADKHRHPQLGHYYWVVCAGSFLDDPLVQLELEMMIDLTERTRA